MEKGQRSRKQDWRQATSGESKVTVLPSDTSAGKAFMRKTGVSTDLLLTRA